MCDEVGGESGRQHYWRSSWGQIMEGLRDHGEQFRLSVLSAMGKLGRVLSRGVT